MPARFHPNVTIDNRSRIAGAVCASVACDTKRIAMRANVVGLQAHLEAVDAGTSTFLIQVDEEARLGPVIIVLCVVTVGLLFLVNDLWLSPEPVMAPPVAVMRSFGGANDRDESNCELHVPRVFL